MISSLIWVRDNQLVEDLYRIKQLSLPGVREDYFCLAAFEMGYQLFPDFGFRLKPQQLCCVSSLPTADLGTCQPL